MTATLWREDDEALRRRLRDDEASRRLWQATAPSGAERPHPRAAGMITRMRATPAGAAAVERLLGGTSRADAHAAIDLIIPPSFAGLDPAFLHHLSLWWGRIADACVAANAEESAIAARLRAIAAWLALADEGTWLRALAEAVIGGTLPPVEVSQALATAALAPIEHVAEVSRASAPIWEVHALRVLARVERAADLSGCQPALRSSAMRRASVLRARLLDEKLAPIGEALREASARGASVPERAEILSRCVTIWKAGEEAEEAERFAADHAIAIGWEAYRASAWNDLRALIQPIAPLAERLARRIEGDASRIAYAAPCAQLLVFEIDTVASSARQIALGERAVAICPTHRNARLVLADLLVERARHALARATWAVDEPTWQRARADIERAAQLWPSTRNLAVARSELERAMRYRAAGSR